MNALLLTRIPDWQVCSEGRNGQPVAGEERKEYQRYPAGCNSHFWVPSSHIPTKTIGVEEQKEAATVCAVARRMRDRDADLVGVTRVTHIVQTSARLTQRQPRIIISPLTPGVHLILS